MFDGGATLYAHTADDELLMDPTPFFNYSHLFSMGTFIFPTSWDQSILWVDFCVPVEHKGYCTYSLTKTQPSVYSGNPDERLSVPF